MHTALAMRIENELGMEEGFLMTLQIFFEIGQEKKKLAEVRHPDLTRFRPALFWDTQIADINWELQKRAVIERVFSRGNLTEKKEVVRYFGATTVRAFLTGKSNAA